MNDTCKHGYVYGRGCPQCPNPGAIPSPTQAECAAREIKFEQDGSQLVDFVSLGKAVDRFCDVTNRLTDAILTIDKNAEVIRKEKEGEISHYERSKKVITDDEVRHICRMTNMNPTVGTMADIRAVCYEMLRHRGLL